jgi:ketosteroid isomerase-like protein
MTLKEKAQDLYNMIGQGQLLEGFDKYYAENVVMTEPRGTREGKSTCRDYEQQFLNSVAEFHGQDVKAIAADEDKGVVFVEVAMDVTFKEGGRVNMEQVAVQRWENGQIVHERFYYQG